MKTGKVESLTGYLGQRVSIHGFETVPIEGQLRELRHVGEHVGGQLLQFVVPQVELLEVTMKVGVTSTIGIHINNGGIRSGVLLTQSWLWLWPPPPCSASSPDLLHDSSRPTGPLEVSTVCTFTFNLPPESATSPFLLSVS